MPLPDNFAWIAKLNGLHIRELCGSERTDVWQKICRRHGGVTKHYLMKHGWKVVKIKFEEIPSREGRS